MSSAQGGSIANLFRLDGKTAIVAGATGGIGLIITLALAEAGADIISIRLPKDPEARNFQQKIEQLGRPFNSNFKDYRSIPQVFSEIYSAGIKADILRHCTGITRHCKVEDTPVEYVDYVMDLNFKAAYMISQEFGRQLLQEGRPGKIIHIASMAANIVQTNISIYAPSKSAVRALTCIDNINDADSSRRR